MNHSWKGKLSPFEWVLLIGFLVTFALSCAVTVRVSQTVLDGDASAEMILAHHLHETGKILSADWYYSTELRILHTQLVFAPLFHLFEDWSTVRAVGTILLHVLLVASFGYLIHAAGMRRKAFFLGASLLLLPASVPYARLVLYHAYYAVYIIIGFLLVGLFLALMDDQERHLGMGRTALHLALFLALSYASSLNGYRQLATTHVALGLMGVIWMYKAQDRTQTLRAIGMLWLTLTGIVAGALGLIENMRLGHLYSFKNFSSMGLFFIDMEKFGGMLFGTLNQFGFRRGIQLLTPTGILSILGAVVCVFFGVHSIRYVMRRDMKQTAAEMVMEYMLPCSFCIIFLIFLLTQQNEYMQNYAVPYSVWFIPLLCQLMTGGPVHQDHPLGRARHVPVRLVGRKLVTYGLCGICMLNGLINMRSFADFENFGQPYEGMPERFQGKHVAELTDVTAFLMQEGYDLGYGNLWKINVMTELSDGKLECVSITHQADGMHYDNWLTLASSRSRDAQKPFLLLHPSERHRAEALASLLKLAYEDEYNLVYDIVDLPAWRALIQPHAEE